MTAQISVVATEADYRADRILAALENAIAIAEKIICESMIEIVDVLEFAKINAMRED